MVKFAAIIALCTFAWAVGVFLLNRLRKPDLTAIETRTADQILARSTFELSILTWNIGYGALGKDANHIMDGGHAMRALSRPEIATAADQIAETLSRGQWDVMCIQENAQPGFLTRGVDVRATIDARLTRYKEVFWADLQSHFFPAFLRVCHGMTSYMAREDRGSRIIALPDADSFFLGILRKTYAGFMTKYPIRDSDKSWVVINLHMPFFGATLTTRTAQLDHLFGIAEQEHAQGNYVILAGDWNMRMCDTEFPHDAHESTTSWLTDFPKGRVPDNWQIAIDPKRPTLRSIHTKYQAGKTFTTIFDGFIVSPNVTIGSVDAHDFGFDLSDHNPVEATFYTRDRSSA